MYENKMKLQQVLKGVAHGVAIVSKESDILPCTGAIIMKISRQGVLMNLQQLDYK